MSCIIETERLTKRYGAARGVTELNLRVEEGGIFGFIGPNGAGKSTTIRTLLGMISPTSGSARLFGRDCLSERRENLAELGYMPSEAMFYRGMRVGEIIRLSAKLRGKDCSAEAARLCERLTLDTKKKVEELSLGNRKKVSIVCALQHNPRLLILDEPTSGLDPLIQREFFELLHERNKAGATVFLSSHVLSEIQRHCDNAAIIRDGKLIVSDKVENLSRTSARRVTLHGAAPEKLPAGAINAAVTADTTTFLYNGEMPELISSLNGLAITDMTITEPDLEEIFMHFYSDKEGE